MSNILLGVTGSVAAIKTPELYRELVASGHQTRIVATKAATYFFDPAEIDPLVEDGRLVRNPSAVVLDEDEWPGADEGVRWRRGDPVLHIELRRWADALVIAPLDANTLAKVATGLADNCLTCVWRAWDLSRPIVLAPAMNTMMWEHPLTIQQLRLVASMVGGVEAPAGAPFDRLIDWLNAHCASLQIVAPQSKQLACGDVGMGALADVATIVHAVHEAATARA